MKIAGSAYHSCCRFIFYLVLISLIAGLRGWALIRVPAREKSPFRNRVLCSSRADGADRCDEPGAPSDICTNEADDTSVHLFSLKWPVETTGCYSKFVRELWQWKDSCLGDGRDFFVPKPKTLTALNCYLKDRIPNVAECSVISNCARFEIVLVLNREFAEDECSLGPLRHALSEVLAAQVVSHQSRGAKFLWRNQLTRFDLPDAIDREPAVQSDVLAIQEIENYWTHLSSVELVSRHLNTIAAGMAERPSRPGRPVPFRPFSSRDAHVLLQLKRIAEIAKGPKTKALLDTALRAGKSARNADKIPELEPLRRYGSGAGRYSQEAPVELSEAAAMAARELAIEPSVRECVAKFQAMEDSERIAYLRTGAQKLGVNANEDKLIQKLLHQPTIDIRAGNFVNIDELHLQIKKRLEEMRAP